MTQDKRPSVPALQKAEPAENSQEQKPYNSVPSKDKYAESREEPKQTAHSHAEKPKESIDCKTRQAATSGDKKTTHRTEFNNSG